MANDILSWWIWILVGIFVGVPIYLTIGKIAIRYLFVPAAAMIRMILSREFNRESYRNCFQEVLKNTKRDYVLVIPWPLVLMVFFVLLFLPICIYGVLYWVLKSLWEGIKEWLRFVGQILMPRD